MNVVFLHNLMYTFRLKCKFIIIKLFSRAYPSNNAGRIFSPDVTKKKHFWYTFWMCFARKGFTYYNHENWTIFYIAYFGDSRVDPTGFHSKQRTEIPQHR